MNQKNGYTPKPQEQHPHGSYPYNPYQPVYPEHLTNPAAGQEENQGHPFNPYGQQEQMPVYTPEEQHSEEPNTWSPAPQSLEQQMPYGHFYQPGQEQHPQPSYPDSSLREPPVYPKQSFQQTESGTAASSMMNRLNGLKEQDDHFETNEPSSYYGNYQSNPYQQPDYTHTNLYGTYPPQQPALPQQSFHYGNLYNHSPHASAHDSRNVVHTISRKKAVYDNGGQTGNIKKRFLASVIDSSIKGVVYFLLYLLFIMPTITALAKQAEAMGQGGDFLGMFTTVAGGMQLFIEKLLLYWILTSILSIVYSCVLPVYLFPGQTIGKKLMGLQVIDLTSESEEQNTPSVGKFFLREIIGKILSKSLFYIGYIMILTDKERHQGLHDRIAKTQVVEYENGY